MDEEKQANATLFLTLGDFMNYFSEVTVHSFLSEHNVDSSLIWK